MDRSGFLGLRPHPAWELPWNPGKGLRINTYFGRKLLVRAASVGLVGAPSPSWRSGRPGMFLMQTGMRNISALEEVSAVEELLRPKLPVQVAKIAGLFRSICHGSSG